MSREDQVGQRAGENSSRIIFVVFLSLLLDLLAFTLILPLLPSILDHFSKNDDGLYKRVQAGVDWFSGSLGIPPERKYNSVLFGGLIGSLFSLLQFLASPLTGAASDSFGRRPALLATALGLIASYALWAVSSSFEVFLCSRILGGISKGNVSLCTAIIADLQCPKARSKGMAIMLSVPGFLLIGWSPNIIILGAGLLFYSFAAAVVVPCLSTVVSGYGLDSQKGTVMGILRSLGALARSLGPVVSATVYWLAGAEVCFTVCASLFLLPFVLLRWMPKPNKEE